MVLRLFSDQVDTIEATQETLSKYDIDSRLVDAVEGTGDNTMFCSIAPKFHQSVATSTDAVLPNGDRFGGSEKGNFFYKRKATATSQPFCFHSETRVLGSCAKLFPKTFVNQDERYGSVGDIMRFPKLDKQHRIRTCTFALKLTRNDGKQFGSGTMTLTETSGRTSSVNISSKGIVTFTTSIDTANECSGPSVSGPKGKTDLHRLTKSAWGEHCV